MEVCLRALLVIVLPAVQLALVETASTLARDLVGGGVLDTGWDHDLERFLLPQLRANRDFRSAHLARTDGSRLQVLRSTACLLDSSRQPTALSGPDRLGAVAAYGEIPSLGQMAGTP